MLRDRGFMRNALERAKRRALHAGLYRGYADAGARYRDAHSGMSGPEAAMRRYWQAMHLNGRGMSA